MFDQALQPADDPAALLRRVAAGDRSAMERFYQIYQENIFRLALARLGDAALAADVLQETLLQIWREAGAASPPADVLPWVLGLAQQKTMEAVRSRGASFPEAPEGSVDDVSPAALANLLRRMDDGSAVHDALAQLGGTQRTALHLAYFEDLPYAQMAQVLGCPEEVVKTRVQHAQRALRRKLSQGT